MLHLRHSLSGYRLLVACLYLDYSVFRAHYLPSSYILQRFGLGTKAGNVGTKVFSVKKLH